MRFLSSLLPLSLIIISSACSVGTDDVQIEVALLTDYQPVQDVVEVHATVDGNPTSLQVHSVVSSDNFLDLQNPLFRFDNLAPNAGRSVTIELVDSAMSVVATSQIYVDNLNDIDVTVRILQTGTNVSCMSEADCVGVAPGACGGVRCAFPYDGGMGSCVLDPTTASCNYNEVCDLQTGCVADVVTPNLCGNGVLESGERCDDGNTVSGDGCSGTCVTMGEACTQHSDCSRIFEVCDLLESNTCEEKDVCGNGKHEPRVRGGITTEECDDGNNVDGDGCSADCKIDVITCTGDYDCDGDDVCDLLGSNTCEPTETCGNGIKEFPERCDDGNTVSGDGCSNTCVTIGEACTQHSDCNRIFEVCDLLESQTCEPKDVCGNGKFEPRVRNGVANETCDDGNNIDGDGCDSDCNFTGAVCTTDYNCGNDVCDLLGSKMCEPANVCGNGKLESGETCDDGDIVSGDGCESDCTITSNTCTSNYDCGNDVCDLLDSNQCEPANVCGNGNKESGEQCDDGNTTSIDGCSDLCAIEAFT